MPLARHRSTNDPNLMDNSTSFPRSAVGAEACGPVGTGIRLALLISVCILISGCDEPGKWLKVATNWDWRARARAEAIAANQSIKLVWTELPIILPRVPLADAIGESDLALLHIRTNRLVDIDSLFDASADPDVFRRAYAQWIDDAAAPEQADPTRCALDFEEILISKKRELTNEEAGFYAAIQQEFGQIKLFKATPQTGVGTLIQELLYATLDASHAELVVAAESLKSKPDFEIAARWFHEPPPWPPASIAKLNRTSNSRELVSILTEQIAPDLESRHWLLASFSGPSKPFDLETLTELATVDGGALISEPRFRAWLREEWTTWARQRYRRVTRLVAKGEVP